MSYSKEQQKEITQLLKKQVETADGYTIYGNFEESNGLITFNMSDELQGGTDTSYVTIDVSIDFDNEDYSYAQYTLKTSAIEQLAKGLSVSKEKFLKLGYVIEYGEDSGEEFTYTDLVTLFNDIGLTRSEAPELFSYLQSIEDN